MNKLLKHGPTIYLGLMSLSWGYDFAIMRDLSGHFTYYFLAESALVDDLMGVLAIISGLLMIGGLALRGEAVTRIGYVIASLTYAMFSFGFWMHSIFVSDTPLSAASPGWTYAGLSLLLMLVGISRWEFENDPHH